MTPHLVDTSVWIAAADRSDPGHNASAKFLAQAVKGDAPLGTLDLTIYETINVTAAKWKSVEASRDLAEQIETACRGELCRIEASDARQIAEIAIENNITAYDAAYVAASRDLGWKLVSLDAADLVSKGLAVTPGMALEAL